MAGPISLNISLERTALWFICQGKSSSTKLYTLLNEDHFFNKVNAALFKRIKFVLKRNNEFMTWDDACEDTSLPDNARRLLKAFDKTTKINNQRCQEIFRKLEEFRKIRVVYNGLKTTLEEKMFNSETIDIESIIDDVAKVVAKARSHDEDDDFFVFGKGGNTDEILEDVLTKGIPTIPSGISRWDAENGGIPLASVVLIGADSGGGKSLVADCIVDNIAEYGAKVCFTSLEMGIDELSVRRLSRYSSVDQGKIFTNSKLSDKEKNKIRSDYKEKQARWAKEGKSVYTKIPKNNPSMEELLISLKPYDFNVIVIDYISLLKGMSGDNAWQKLVDGVNFAKTFARNTGTTVILLVQITKEQTLKYAKGMIDGADLVWFFTKDQSVIDTGILFINTPKARKQKAISFPVKAEYEYARITNVPDDYKPPQVKDLISKEIKTQVIANSNKKTPTKSDALMQEFFGKPKKKAA